MLSVYCIIILIDLSLYTIKSPRDINRLRFYQNLPVYGHFLREKPLFLLSLWTCIFRFLPYGLTLTPILLKGKITRFKDIVVVYYVQLYSFRATPNPSRQAVGEMHVHLMKYVSTLVTYIQSRQSGGPLLHISLHMPTHNLACDYLSSISAAPLMRPISVSKISQLQ